jgi:hypothetical protein
MSDGGITVLNVLNELLKTKWRCNMTTEENKMKKCPFCGALQKYPTKNTPEGYELPTTYTCGTVTSPYWKPLRYCKEV